MNESLAAYLRTRRTIPAAQMRDPGPGGQVLRAMLTIAARVPDHGKLAPWRLIVFERETRDEVIAGLQRIAAADPNEREARVRAEKARQFGEAPVVVGVVSAPIPDHPKIPLWEQQLSAGAVCLNLIHAAAAQGFAAQWLTGWFAYDEEARAWLGMRERERLAGFIHIGTPAAQPTERDRPDIDAITTVWRPNGVHPSEQNN